MRTARASSIGARARRGAATAALTLLPVAVLAGLVHAGWGPLVGTDARVIVATTDVTRAHAGMLSALVAWQEVTQPLHVHLAALLGVACVAWRLADLRVRALWAAATILVGWNLGLDLKLLVRRARPDVLDPVSTAPGFSFPSGHVFNVTLALVVLAVLLWPLLRTGGARVAYLAVAAPIVAVTALDRVFLGVHYPSDTVAGALFAAAVVATSWAVFGRSADPTALSTTSKDAR